jgi:GTP diphosphokinase / guanosine-3',5'-bis(diphosphate) 3'-diphosphatase
MLKLADAIQFAKLAHEGQFRTNGEAYFNHPFRVMLCVANYTRDEDVLCAAVLHDVIEDTKYDFEDINMRFGFEVASMVYELANKDDMALKRAERIAAREAKYKLLSKHATLIKLADRLDNVQDLEGMESQIEKEINKLK